MKSMVGDKVSLHCAPLRASSLISRQCANNLLNQSAFREEAGLGDFTANWWTGSAKVKRLERVEL